MTGSAGDIGERSRHVSDRPVTVALVNDYQVVVEQLRDMLSPFSARVRVVDMEIGTTDVAPADVALFDTLGGQRHALTRAKELVERRGVGHVMIYARAPSPAFVRAAAAAGVSQVVDKSTTGEDLVDLIEAVADDRPHVAHHRGPRTNTGDDELTLRDRELLALLAKGLSNEQIGEELFLGIETVRTHLRGLFRKLGVQKRTEAATHARPLGLTSEVSTGTTPGRRISRHFHLRPVEIRAARAFVADELRANDATEQQVELMTLAVSELAANAVAHSGRSGWTVGIKATRQWYTMDVSGGGAAQDSVIFQPERWTIADAERPSGRGLGIVRELMDQVAVRTWRGQVRVICRLRRADA